MHSFDLREARAEIPEFAGATAYGLVTDVVTDSRLAAPRSLFVALEGERSDGHRFVADALARGARACLVRRGKRPAGVPLDRLIEVDDPLRCLGAIGRFVRRKLTCAVVGITGSIGKTTTKELVAAVLGSSLRVEKAPESFNNAIGVPLTIFRARPETEVLVAELGANHRGEIAALAEILRPTIGMIVSIAPVHLEGFGSVEGVIEAKGELAAALQPEGKLYLPADIPGLDSFRRRARCRVRLFGEGTETRGEVVRADGEGLVFSVGGMGEFSIPGAFRHHLRSALGAVALAIDFGIARPAIAEKLLSFTFPRLRWQREEVGGATFVLDCYNANPESVRGALDAALELAGGRRRLVAVLGDMCELGTASARYHRELGEDLAGRSLSRVFLCGDEVRATYEALAAGGFAGEADLYDDRDRLARDVARAVAPGDVVLFKGSRTLKLEEVARKVKELLFKTEAAPAAR